MAHLAACLQRVQPTAMGLIPSTSLDTAIRDAQKKERYNEVRSDSTKNDFDERGTGGEKP